MPSEERFYSNILEPAIPHKGKMAKNLRGSCGLLLSTAEGKFLGHLGDFEYHWLKQVAIILVCSNWLGLVRAGQGYSFPFLDRP